ncbi:MAG: SRPBCC family protein [Thermoleophilia bacterium]
MIKNTASVVVPNLTPSQIIDFLMKLDNESYQRWHKDHIRYRLISSEEAIVGTKLFLEEKLEGKFHIGYEFKIIDYKPDTQIVYKAKYPIPVYLILTLEARQQTTLVTQVIEIGYDNWLAALIDPVVSLFILTTKNREILTRHVAEEFLNIETCLKTAKD